MSSLHDVEPLIDEQTRYIIFDVSDQTFATPLLSVREIVEPLPLQSVASPYAAFLGLANLRGQIIGVVDFATCLGEVSTTDAASQKLIVFDGGDTKLALVVDEVHASLPIADENIVREPLIKAPIPPAAFIGIAKVERKIISIVSLTDLAACLPELGNL